LLGGCAGTQVVVPRRPLTAHDYLPLRRNAAWSFDALDSNVANGVQTLVTLRVTRQEGESYWMSQGARSNSVYMYAQGGILRDGETILADPIAVGTTWQGIQGDRYTIRAINQRRQTPAGTFSNVVEVVRTGQQDFSEITWYAADVGPIESRTPVVVHGEIREYRLVLRGYTLDGQF
jgi:hypothetical protein